MTDIVERLRAADISGHGTYSALVREAADEIERQQADIDKLLAENERLRALNRKLASGDLDIIALCDSENRLEDKIDRLRAALKDARDALRNDFEPDNQSRAWHRANAALGGGKVKDGSG